MGLTRIGVFNTPHVVAAAGKQAPAPIAGGVGPLGLWHYIASKFQMLLPFDPVRPFLLDTLPQEPNGIC